MLLKFQLTVGERQVMRHIMGNFRDGSAESAHKIREIGRNFKLRDASHFLDKLNEDLREYGMATTWEAFLEPSQFVEFLQRRVDTEKEALEKIEDDKDAAKSIQDGIDDLLDLIKRAKTFDKREVFTIDDIYSKWLVKKVLDTADLSKRWTTDQRGQTSEVDAPLSMGLMELFANLHEAVSSSDPVSSKKDNLTEK